MFVPSPNMGQPQLTGAGLVTFCLIQSCHTHVLFLGKVVWDPLVLARTESLTLGWLPKRCFLFFSSCGVHVAREEGIPFELPAVFSCQMCPADFCALVPAWSELSFPLTCLSSHRYWHYHEGCGAVTAEGLRVLDGETSLLLPAHD